MSIQINDITNAMFSSLEGYVSYVVDSMAFSLGRELTSEEQQAVFRIVEDAVSKMTTAMEDGAETTI